MNKQNEAKHTPRPWKAHVSSPEKRINHYVTAGPQDTIPICRTGCDLNSAADAHLIAAAPEMLEVCRLIKDKCYPDAVGRTAVKAAKEAYAKGTGDDNDE